MLTLTVNCRRKWVEKFLTFQDILTGKACAFMRQLRNITEVIGKQREWEFGYEDPRTKTCFDMATDETVVDVTD